MSKVNSTQYQHPCVSLFKDVKDIGYAVVNTGIVCVKALYNEGPIRILQKSCKVTSYYQEIKLLYALVNLIAIKQLEALGNTFKMLQDMLLALMVFDNFTKMVDSLGKVEWYKTVSNVLRFVASILDVALVVERYVGIKIPVYTEVREVIVESECVQSANSPLLINLISKPKDIVIFLDCIWNIGVQTVLFLSNNAKNRAKALEPKAILDTAGNIGKMLLITFGPGYYWSIAFRITAVVVGIIGLLKQLVFE